MVLLPFLSYKTPTRTYHMCLNYYRCFQTRHQSGLISCALITLVIIRTYHMCLNYILCYHTRHQPELITCALIITLVIIKDTNGNLSYVLKLSLTSYKTPIRTYHMCFNYPCYHIRHQPGLITCALIITLVIIQNTNQNLLYVL